LDPIEAITGEIGRLNPIRYFGKVTSILGMLVEIGGIESHLSIGDRVYLINRSNKPIACEIVGFKNDRAMAMAFADLDGIGLGTKAVAESVDPAVYPSDAWLGRVVNAFGEPIDGKGPIAQGQKAYPLRAMPPAAHARQRVGGKMDLGIRAINTFLSCCRGQRMGVFSGSGVGKSTVMSMMAKYTSAQVSVIGLVGERGREVQEFIQDDLGEEGLKRSVVVVATSDESPLMRRQAAYLTLSVSEFFRDKGQDVLCLMDSITRFAMAQREIGLSAGEPPTSKGYTPTVFTELPRLLERAGPGAKGQGHITGLFTVLVEGDDSNEPISDAVRGIVDGHIMMDRAIADRGRYPAINILKSVSRTMPGCNNDQENAIVNKARQYLSVYEDMAEMIRLGAYRAGSDAKVDEAIRYYPAIEAFLKQGEHERSNFKTGYEQLAAILAK